ncbi:MAG TPA: hypothetical protein VFS21_09240 [Roseiflexaceae bacterium]|nr:hypothetical protein [Roseiflexaceae bacterium]
MSTLRRSTNSPPARSGRAAGPPRVPIRGPDLRALAVLGAGIVFIYLAAVLRFPLLAIYNLPLQNLDKLTGASGATGMVMASCLAMLFGSYALGALSLRGNAPAGDWRWRSGALYLVLFGMPLLFVLVLLFAYPTTSLDLYDYLFRGRMLARYQVNTFIFAPQDFPSDPLMDSRPVRFIPWSRAVTAYGPLWEGMSWLTARLAGETPGEGVATIDPSLLRLLLGYKALGALGYLLCGCAIWLALARAEPRMRLLGTYLWLWNPLALWESVAAGHNDAWMALLIVLAVWAASGSLGLSPAGQSPPRRGPQPPPEGRPLLAFLILTAGGLIKYSALFLGPVLLVSALRQQGSREARLRLVVGGALACGGLVALAYAPFWAGLDTFRAFGDRGTLFTASWLAVLQALLVEQRLMEQGPAQQLASALALALLVAGVLWSAARAWVEPRAVARHCLWLMLWFLLVCNTWFQPWYLLWALALVALQPHRTAMVAVLGIFCCTGMLTYLANTFLRTAIDVPVGAWPGESAAWNILLSLLIYAPPLLGLLWRERRRETVRRGARGVRRLEARG